jgi:hypothetical protein
MTQSELGSGWVSRLAYAWRALRTALAFLVFGAGALIVAFAVIPSLRVLSLAGRQTSRSGPSVWYTMLSVGSNGSCPSWGSSVFSA